MGRSSKEQAQRNREAIVETACGLFRQFGVDSVSIADVMHATGMTTGGFYRHFPSKDALVAEAFTLAFEKAATAWQNTLKRQQNSPDALAKSYFQKRPANQTCPILAFAQYTAASAVEHPSTQVYEQGAKHLFQTFLDHRPEDKNASVLFAAMIGARFLAMATHDAAWVQSIQRAVSKPTPWFD